ncbi:MAG: positive regulator of sigma(E), RseC/MucC [Magnetococcales bacterium]|nr:positive regulator of sigma(E), RseC/MucC [Magnetococcales bacterium]
MVVALEGDMAVVVGQRASGCGSCHQDGACATLSFGSGRRAVRLRAENPAGAKVGDRVVLEISERHFLRASFLVYIVPILALFAGGLLLRQLALLLGVTQRVAEGVGGVGGVCALLLVLLWLKRYNQRLDVNGGGYPVIRTIVGDASRMGGAEPMVAPMIFQPRSRDLD